MRTLRSGSAAVLLPFDYPAGWSAVDLAGLELTVRRADTGEVLIEAQEVELPPVWVLAADANRYTTEIMIELPEEPEEPPEEPPPAFIHPEPGDRLFLWGSTGGEFVFVRGYAVDTGVVTLERVLNESYLAGCEAYGLTVTPEIDVSDTDEFPRGLRVYLEWIPEGTGAPVSEEAEIETYRQEDPGAFRRYVESISPRVYRGVTHPVDRFNDVYAAAQEALRVELVSANVDISRVMDSTILRPCLRYLMALIWSEDCDQDLGDEVKTWTAGYTRAFKMLMSNPIWTDNDGDGAQGPGEDLPHETTWERSW